MARIGLNIYERVDRRFEGRYKKGRKENGRIHYGYVYSYDFNEVKKTLEYLKEKYGVSRPNIENKYNTVSQWLDYWLNKIIRLCVKESTYQNYSGTAERYIIPFLGKKDIDCLSRNEIQAFVDALKSKNLSPAYIHSIYRLLKSSLKKALEMNVIYMDPCKSIILPKRTHSKVMPLTLDEQNALEAAALNDKGGAAVMLSLYTGMRIGEICALTWEDIDFNRDTINVRRTLQRIPDSSSISKKTKIHFGKPKTRESQRIIPMPSCLSDYLSSLKKLTYGKYVISNKNSYIEPRSLSNHYQKLLRKAKIAPVSFHNLRHTFATRCMETNVDITTLSKLLGHSSVKMTLDIYTDAVMKHKTAAINKLNNIYIDPS